MAGKRYTRKVEAIRTPTDLDVAWIAGLYEGEGSCYEGKNKSCSAGIYQKDPEILYRCLEMFGGNISQNRHLTPEKICHVWNLGGDDARMFLQIIYPFMSARRKLQIDKTSFRRFTGVERVTRPDMSDERKASREYMTAAQRKQESKDQWVSRNRERHLATRRLASRKYYAKNKNTAEAQLIN